MLDSATLTRGMGAQITLYTRLLENSLKDGDLDLESLARQKCINATNRVRIDFEIV